MNIPAMLLAAALAVVTALTFALWLISASPRQLAEILIGTRPRPTASQAVELAWIRSDAARSNEMLISARAALDRNSAEIERLSEELERITAGCCRLLAALEHESDRLTDDEQTDLQDAIEALISESAIAERRNPAWV